MIILVPEGCCDKAPCLAEVVTDVLPTMLSSLCVSGPASHLFSYQTNWINSLPFSNTSLPYFRYVMTLLPSKVTGNKV